MSESSQGAVLINFQIRELKCFAFLLWQGNENDLTCNKA